jgi:hypothetical protein
MSHKGIIESNIQEFRDIGIMRKFCRIEALGRPEDATPDDAAFKKDGEHDRWL